MFAIPVYEKLKKMAADENRSVGAQIRILVAQGLDENRQKAEV